MKIGFLYGGQGSQEQGMGFDFYNNSASAKKIYDQYILASRIKNISFKIAKEDLSQTENTQLALVAFQIMVDKMFASKGIIPKGVCGLSIGEYSALYSARVLSEEDVLKIAQIRGKEMSLCAGDISTSMYAISTFDRHGLEGILNEYNEPNRFVQVSNVNGPRQIVISGEEGVLNRIIKKLDKKKIKSIKLNVSGPFHTDYMAPAAEKLKDYFSQLDFNLPEKDLYLNVTGAAYQGEDLKEMMVEQVKNTVLFAKDIESMIEDGIDIFVEIGFNQVIKRIVRKIDKNVKVFSVATYGDFKNVVEEINGK